MGKEAGLKAAVGGFLERWRDYHAELQNAIEDADTVRQRDALNGITDLVDTLKAEYESKA